MINDTYPSDPHCPASVREFAKAVENDLREGYEGVEEIAVEHLFPVRKAVAKFKSMLEICKIALGRYPATAISMYPQLKVLREQWEGQHKRTQEQLIAMEELLSAWEEVLETVVDTSETTDVD